MPSNPLPNESNYSDVAASPKRGDIYYVDLEPVVGSEQGGRRPAPISERCRQYVQPCLNCRGDNVAPCQNSAPDGCGYYAR